VPDKVAPPPDIDGEAKSKPTDPDASELLRIRKMSIEGIKPVVSESGVKYWDIKVGEGESPRIKDTAVLNLSSWMKDGMLWFTTEKQGYPVKLLLEQVPPGLAEGLLSMKVGGKRRIEIPSRLAFGESGLPGRVPPGADLVYQAKLIAVKQYIEPPKQTSVAGIESTIMPSGVKYWDFKVGKGKSPKPNSIVTVHYAGWLSDGKLFHNTIQEGRPESFRLDKIVKGFAEGLRSMKVGGKRRLEIPPELGYGKKGQGQFIPPNSRLFFEVELFDVQRPLPPPKQTSVKGIKPVVLPSGLKYWDLKVGDGESPNLASNITVHYTGWLTDGTVFDSSIDRGQPLRIRLGRMIKGWGEGLKTMKAGGKRRLEIPYELGYGEDGIAPSVPPKARLIYELELLEVIN
jgi:FKBP-type peptidyl-prolyl cis-trans isomerase